MTEDEETPEAPPKKRKPKAPKPPELPPVLLFKITRRDPARIHDILLAGGNTEGIEAHRYEFTKHGDLVFYRFIEAEHVPQGVSYSFRTVKIFAAGTVWDVEDITEAFKTQSSVS